MNGLVPGTIYDPVGFNISGPGPCFDRYHIINISIRGRFILQTGG
ncbi:MAG: hypothetical protein WAU51_06920 [Methanoregula sp.]